MPRSLGQGGRDRAQGGRKKVRRIWSFLLKGHPKEVVRHLYKKPKEVISVV